MTTDRFEKGLAARDGVPGGEHVERSLAPADWSGRMSSKVLAELDASMSQSLGVSA